MSRGIDAAAERVAAWMAAGATHVAINTMGMGAGGIDGHIGELAEMASAIGLPPRDAS